MQRIFLLLALLPLPELARSASTAGEMEESCRIMLSVMARAAQSGDELASPKASEAVQFGTCMGFMEGLETGVIFSQAVLNVGQQTDQKYPSCVFEEFSIATLADSFVRFVSAHAALREKKVSTALVPFLFWEDNGANCPRVVAGGEPPASTGRQESKHGAGASTSSPFVATPQADANAEPLVDVVNASSYQLTLKVGRETKDIAAGQKVNFSLPHGTHQFHASAPGVLPATGQQTFQRGYQYSWKFTVVTTRLGGRRKRR